MTRYGLLDADGQLVAVVMSLDGEAYVSTVEVPDGYPEGWRWNSETLEFEPYTPPRRLTGLEIIGLYTPAQHARARRMLNAVYPEGHPWAGQLVDPDALIQRLLDAALAMPGTISIDDPFHVNGTALNRALGVIESDEEAARILAGIPPEESES